MAVRGEDFGHDHGHGYGHDGVRATFATVTMLDAMRSEAVIHALLARGDAPEVLLMVSWVRDAIASAIG